MRRTPLLTAALLLAAAAAATPVPADRVLRTELVLDAPIDAVWAAWTTPAGIESFFGPACRVEPRVGGAYEVYFYPGAAAGERGAEGATILAFEPPRRLAFTWNAPVDMPHVRAQRTQVFVELEALDPARTRLRFTHAGWGTGDEWDRAYAFFDRGWNALVLPRLRHRFAHGPIDWSAPPTALAPVTDTLRVALAPVARER